MGHKILMLGLSMASVLMSTQTAEAADLRYVWLIFFTPNGPAFGHFNVDATLHDNTITGHIEGKHRSDGRFEGLIKADGQWQGQGVDPAGQS